MNPQTTATPLALPWPAWHTAYNDDYSSEDACIAAHRRRREFIAAMSDRELLEKHAQNRAFIAAGLTMVHRPQGYHSWANDLDCALSTEIVLRFRERVTRDECDARRGRFPMFPADADALDQELNITLQPLGC